MSDSIDPAKDVTSNDSAAASAAPSSDSLWARFRLSQEGLSSGTAEGMARARAVLQSWQGELDADAARPAWERALVTLGLGQWEATVAERDGAERLLQGTTDAITAFGQPLEQLAGADAFRVWGLVWMNRGNAFQTPPKPDRLDRAVEAYDQAIAGFERALALGEDENSRNSLGAAWMNRGRACQCLGNLEAWKSACASYRKAAEILSSLSGWWPRLNTAAARANLAVALAEAAEDLGTEAVQESETLVTAVLETLNTDVRRDPTVADIALKAMRARLCTLGAVLTAQTKEGGAPASEVVTQAGDTLEESLDLLRHWLNAGVRPFEGLAWRFVRMGFGFYAQAQPQFAAEFVREWLVESPLSPGEPLAQLQREAVDILGMAEARLRREVRVDATDERTQWLIGVVNETATLRQQLIDFLQGPPTTTTA